MSDEIGLRGGARNIRDSLSVASEAANRDAPQIYEFGPFRLEPSERKLLRGNEIVTLTPKAFDTLVLLVRNSGHLMEKDELLRRLWPDSFVEEGSLSNNIFMLRKALGEDPPFIETVPRRGYRFVGAVRQLPDAAPTRLEKPLVEGYREVANEVSKDLRPSSAVVAAIPMNSGIAKPTTSRGWALRVSMLIGAFAGSATVYPGKEAGRTSSIGQHKLLSIASGLVLVSLLVTIGWYFTRRLRSSNIAHAKIAHKQFTFTGDAYSPAISPDGLFVAYVSKKFGEQQKLIVQASNGTKVELAQGARIEFPRWSPDGSEVLFLRRDPGVDKVDQTAKGSGIYVVSRLGGVARLTDKGGLACWLAQDGSQIVTGGDAGVNGAKGVRLVNKLSGEVKEVHLSEYTWLWDVDCSARAGLILTVTRTSDKFQMRIFKPDGSDERKLVEDSDMIYSARWSPTGDSIYYLHGEGSTSQLSKLSVTRRDAEPVQLADGLQTGRDFTLSADGSRLAYTREDHSSNLWRVDLPTTEKRAKPEISRLTSGTSYYGEPSFSPNGRWMAFALGPNPNETNIFKRPVAGGEPVQLTFFEHAATASPAWSPDGQRIAFIGHQHGTLRVWMISANGGAAQPLENTNASDTDRKLAWWPSSEIVYQQSGLRSYLQINDKTHEEKPIIQTDQSVGWLPAGPFFSPDGKKMAVWWNRKDKGLWIISLEPNSETFLRSGYIDPVGWSPDEKYVYAIRGETGLPGREIIRVQVAAPNEVTSVASLPGHVVNFDGASVSPDGHEIVVSVSEEKSDVWLMEHFDPSPR